MKLLENKTVVITGASRGIGRGIAVLAKHGANIILIQSLLMLQFHFQMKLLNLV